MPTAIFASPVILMWSWLEALQILADVQNQLVSSIGETAWYMLIPIMILDSAESYVLGKSGKMLISRYLAVRVRNFSGNRRHFVANS